MRFFSWKNGPALLISVSLLVSGCAQNGPAGTIAGGDAESAAAESNAAISDYRIGPGDSLQIFVWRHEDISVTVPVRPDGKISTPLVKEIRAEGKTPGELSTDIENVLSQYIKNPVVTVIVNSFVGTFSEQIRVLGQAAEPRALSYRENITLLDVMIEVGGLTEFAAGNRAKVIRRENGAEREIRVRINDLIERGKIEENIKMKPGDILIIPESWL